MVRLSVELLDDAPQFINTVRERELNLRNYKIPVIENMGVTRDQFDYIDMSDNDIKKLDNFPLLMRLRALYLHNNRVQYIQANIGEVLPNLRILALTNNNICELGDIDALATCPLLEHVTFIGNPLTHKPHYRLYVIYKLPSVRVLDFKRVRLAEREAAKKMFKGKKNAKKRAEVAVKSTAPVVEDVEKELVRGNTITVEEKKKIEEAIANAKNLAEIEYLQAILTSGKIPEKGWNRTMDYQSEEPQKNTNEFVQENEEMETNEKEN